MGFCAQEINHAWKILVSPAAQFNIYLFCWPWIYWNQTWIAGNPCTKLYRLEKRDGHRCQILEGKKHLVIEGLIPSKIWWLDGVFFSDIWLTWLTDIISHGAWHHSTHYMVSDLCNNQDNVSPRLAKSARRSLLRLTTHLTSSLRAMVVSSTMCNHV